MSFINISLVIFICLASLVACNRSTKTAVKIPSDAFLVDVRTAREFAKGSVVGAINIPLDSVEDRLSEFSNKDTIVVFCRSGHRSGKVKKLLATKGITNVVNGGSWKQVRSKRNK